MTSAPTEATKPPFAYYGGKQLLAQRLIALMPEHRHYVEPFAGSLSVLLAKPRAQMETVNDLDGDLVAFWRVLRDRPANLERACWLTPHSRTEREIAAKNPVDDELEQARRVWVQLSQGRTGRRTDTGWKHHQDARGTNRSMPYYLAAYCERIAPCSTRLAGVSLDSRPAVEVIEQYGRHDTTLLYVDPPYFVKRSVGYVVEMKKRQQHEELLAALRACRAKVLLSNYPNDLYDSTLADWHRLQIKTWTGQGGSREDRTEVVWMNYDPPTTDHGLFGEAS
jgi:DNA adenine methylase